MHYFFSCQGATLLIKINSFVYVPVDLMIFPEIQHYHDSTYDLNMKKMMKIVILCLL